MEMAKYLIIGAGVSGLAFANAIHSDDYLILEKEAKPGGYCRTERRGEYVWDYAGHFFHFSHPELKARFEKTIPEDAMVLRKKNTKIFYKGNYVDYPFQKNIHQLSKKEMIDCLYDLFERTEKPQYDHFLEMLYGKFGKSITEKFLRPYNEKLYACSLQELDVDAMGRFFPYADTKEIIRNMKNRDDTSYNQFFSYPKQGAAVFVEKLLEGVENCRLHMNEKAIKIDLGKKILETDKNVYSYDYLISSAPLNEFADISDLSFLLNKNDLSYNQVLVLNLGFDKPSKDRSIHWIYVPSKEINFYRAGFYSNIIGTEKLSMYIEIGYPKNYTILQTEKDYQLAETLKNLKMMKIIDDHRLVDYQALVMNPAYVHITEKGKKTVQQLKEQLKEKGVYLTGRYGSWKYCSIEDCMIDAFHIAEEIDE